MDTQTKTTAKDFFLHLGAMIALYWSAGVLLNLLNSIINSVFPPIDAYYRMYSSISFPVASLIVIFPVYLLLSWLNQKSYVLDPSKKEIWVKRWIEYVTLFVSGAILLGSLVSVIYLFLDGQELTAGFLLKVLAWLVVTGLIFGYHIGDIRERNTSGSRKVWAGITIFIVVAAIVTGFVVTGSPRTQRLMRYDDQKVSDLQNIQNQIVSYWQSKGALPQGLQDLDDTLSYMVVPLDPQTQMEYGYTKKSEVSFELCATFNKAAKEVSQSNVSTLYQYDMEQEKWTHESGYQCFERTIDPDRYPPFKKGM